MKKVIYLCVALSFLCGCVDTGSNNLLLKEYLLMSPKEKNEVLENMSMDKRSKFIKFVIESDGKTEKELNDKFHKPLTLGDIVSLP